MLSDSLFVPNSCPLSLVEDILVCPTICSKKVKMNLLNCYLYRFDKNNIIVWTVNKNSKIRQIQEIRPIRADAKYVSSSNN